MKKIQDIKKQYKIPINYKHPIIYFILKITIY